MNFRHLSTTVLLLITPLAFAACAQEQESSGSQSANITASACNQAQGCDGDDVCRPTGAEFDLVSEVYDDTFACQPLGAVGDFCHGSASCKSDLTCVGVNTQLYPPIPGTCKDTGKGHCDGNASCGDELCRPTRSADDGFNFECAAEGQEGDKCTGDEKQCATDLICKDSRYGRPVGRCSSALPSGSDCEKDVQCDNGLICRPDSRFSHKTECIEPGELRDPCLKSSDCHTGQCMSVEKNTPGRCVR